MPALKAGAMRSNWSGVVTACNGCGANLARDPVEHRPDCTVEPSPLLCADCDAIRLPSERKPVWRYDPNTRTYHCPNHPKEAP